MLRRLLLLLVLPALLSPAVAVRRIDVGLDGKTCIAALDNGELLVFDEPGKVRARRQFGNGLVSLSASPSAPIVMVVRLNDSPEAELPQLVVERWNYETDQLAAAAPEIAVAAADLLVARGGHAVLVCARELIRVVDIETLTLRRTIAAPGLLDGARDLALDEHDWRVAVATGGAIWLGRTEDEQLAKTDVGLSRGPSPRVWFADDGQTVLACGNLGLVELPVVGTPRVIPTGELRPGSAFAVSSDPRFAYLADGPKLTMVQRADGQVHSSAAVRPGPAAASDLAVSRGYGRLAVLYDDDRVVWYDPIRRLATAAYPPLPGVGSSLPAVIAPLPGGGSERLATLQRVLAAPDVFVQRGEILDFFVLDAEFNRLAALEDAAALNGWQALVAAVLAVKLGQPDQVPPPFAGLEDALSRVDELQLRNVGPAPGLTPAALAQAVGPGLPTGTDHMTGEQKVYPIYRYGPFALPTDGDRFPEGIGLILTASWLKEWLTGGG